MKKQLSHKVVGVLVIETIIVVGLLLAFIFIPGKNKNIKPQKIPVPLASIVKDRLVVYVPLPHAQISKEVLIIGGKMRDFFEGTVTIRVRNNVGSIRMTEPVTAQSSNYGLFAPFQASFSIPATDKGPFTIEFVDVSPKNGSEKVLLKIPVTFK